MKVPTDAVTEAPTPLALESTLSALKAAPLEVATTAYFKLAERHPPPFPRSAQLHGREYRLGAGISGGIFPEDGTDAASLLRSVDIAMYRVKWNGQSNFQFCSTRSNTLSPDRLSMEASLARALKQESELSLAFQPIQQLAQGSISGFEALTRWSQPELGNVPPGRFIPLAEETGLIRALGLLAL